MITLCVLITYLLYLCEAEASYVAGFPVPLPLPPCEFLVSYKTLALSAH